MSDMAERAPRRTRWASLSVRSQGIGLLLSTGLMACSFVVASDREQCTTDQDCRALASNAVCRSNVCAVAVASPSDAGTEDVAPTDPAWACLGQVTSPSTDRSAAVDARFVFTDSSKQPVAGVTVKACTIVDVGCSDPFAGPFVSDAQGVVSVPLFTGFRGFLDVAPPESTPGFIPALYYVPVLDAEREPRPELSVGLTTKAELEEIAAQAGKTIDWSGSHVFFTAYDCRNERAADVTVRSGTITIQTFSYYADANGSPNATLQVTTSSGSGGLLNLPTGIVTVSYSRKSGERIGAQNIFGRPGTIGLVVASPTPD